MGGNLGESKSCDCSVPARGAGADGTFVNIAGRRLNTPTATFAPDGITLESKLIFFLHLFGYYWPGANTFPGFISHHLAFLPPCADVGF